MSFVMFLYKFYVSVMILYVLDSRTKNIARLNECRLNFESLTLGTEKDTLLFHSNSNSDKVAGA